MQVVIAGGGEAGQEMAKHFAPGYDVVVVESNALVAERLQGLFDGQVICGSVVNAAVLRDAQVLGPSLFIAATGADEVNILSCLAARQLGAVQTAACVRGYSAETVSSLFSPEGHKLSWIINPYQLAADKIAAEITGYRDSTKGCALASPFAVTQVVFRPGLPGDASSETECSVLSRGGKMIPAAGEILQHGDRLYRIHHVRKDTSRALPGQTWKRVLISGAGGLGAALAMKLSALQLPASIHLYDPDEGLCRRAAEDIPHCRVYQRDTAGSNFWQYVLPHEKDIFIAASRADHKNLLAALAAKQHGVETVSVAWQAQYRQAIRTAGFSNVVAPYVLAAQFLFHRLQQGKGVNIIQLSGDGDTLVEVAAELICRTDGRPPSQFRLSKGLLYAGCVRREILLTPQSGGKINPGDVFLFFAASGRTPSLFADLKLHPGPGRLRRRQV